MAEILAGSLQRANEAWFVANRMIESGMTVSAFVGGRIRAFEADCKRQGGLMLIDRTTGEVVAPQEGSAVIVRWKLKTA